MFTCLTVTFWEKSRPSDSSVMPDFIVSLFDGLGFVLFLRFAKEAFFLLDGFQFQDGLRGSVAVAVQRQLVFFVFIISLARWLLDCLTNVPREGGLYIHANVRQFYYPTSWLS